MDAETSQRQAVALRCGCERGCQMDVAASETISQRPRMLLVTASAEPSHAAIGDSHACCGRYRSIARTRPLT
jgi:hypothetical protein